MSKSAAEKALKIIENTTRIRLQDLKDNPGAKVPVGNLYFTTYITRYDLLRLTSKICFFTRFLKKNICSQKRVNGEKNFEFSKIIIR